MAIRNLVFDVGNVLLEYRWKEFLMDYGLSAEEAERVGREMFDDPDQLWHIFDLGTMKDEEIVAEFCRKHPADADAISFFINHGEYMHIARPEVWKKVHALKEKGYRIYILSNYPERLFKVHVEYADFMRDLDGLVVSYMIHKGKPDAAIYEELMNRYDLVPEECLFFDDRKENVDGAVACGMRSIQVTGRKMLADELDKILKDEQSISGIS